MYYVFIDKGNDKEEGNEEKPLSSINEALRRGGDKSNIKVKREEDEEYKLISQNAMKKAQKQIIVQNRKEKKNSSAQVLTKKLEKYKIVLEDSNEEKAIPIKIRDIQDYKDKETRVSIRGWVQKHTFMKNVLFITIRDGSGYLQCVLKGDLCKTYEAINITTESTAILYGVVKSVPKNATAPGGVELIVDYWEIIGMAPSGEESIENRIPSDSGPSILLDNRHLYHRTYTGAKLLIIRNYLLRAFRKFYELNHYVEVNPPCFVQTQIEGGSTLFSLDYFGEPAYLTQSSQLYLESVVPIVGDAYCIQSSFRSERSRTRRHLSEYTHIEAECAFIAYEELINRVEDLVCFIVDYVLESPIAEDLLSMNPNLKKLSRPFIRMDYKDAIKWLNENGIKKEEDNSEFVYGDDIPERPERFMTDTIGKPIFLCRFPHEIKAFYMKRDKDDNEVTESFDLLMPGVGEIVGGSMRISDKDHLLNAFKAHDISPDPYYWFVDLRTYGTFPHGGYGLGFDRFITWIANRHHIRDVCLYPRYIGRCRP